MKIDSSASMRPWRLAAVAIWRRRARFAKCSPQPTSRRSSTCRATTEKQNKIEAIELEAMGALRTSISSGSTELARSLSEPDHRAFQIGPRQRSKPGPRTFAKFTKNALIYTIAVGPVDRARFPASHASVPASSTRWKPFAGG